MAGKVADRTFPVACPLPDCKKSIGAAEAGLVLSPEEQATLGQVGQGGASAGGGEGVVDRGAEWDARMHCQVLNSCRL